MEKRIPLVIVGGGGHARELRYHIEEINQEKPRFELLGYVDDNPALQGKEQLGLPVLGDLGWLSRQSSRKVCYTIGIGDSRIRRLIAERLRGVPVAPALIHPSASVSPWSELGPGTQVCPGARISVNTRIGAHCLINWLGIIGHEATIGDFVTIGPRSLLAGGSRVDSGAFLGLNVNLNPLVRVGENSIVGSGATVVVDICANVTAVGTPARPIRHHKVPSHRGNKPVFGPRHDVTLPPIPAAAERPSMVAVGA